MDAAAIIACAKDVAQELVDELKKHRLTRVDIDCIRSACVGYLHGKQTKVPAEHFEVIVEATLRKFVEFA